MIRKPVLWVVSHVRKTSLVVKETPAPARQRTRRKPAEVSLSSTLVYFSAWETSASRESTRRQYGQFYFGALYHGGIALQRKNDVSKDYGNQKRKLGITHHSPEMFKNSALLRATPMRILLLSFVLENSSRRCPQKMFCAMLVLITLMEAKIIILPQRSVVTMLVVAFARKVKTDAMAYFTSASVYCYVQTFGYQSEFIL